MLSLMLWFFNNTAFNIQSSAESFGARAAFYGFAFFTWIADIASFFAKEIIGVACLLTYMLSYIILVYLLFSVQQFAPKEMRFHLHVSKLWIPLVVMAIISLLVIHKVAGFQATPFHIAVDVHAIILTLLALITANMWGVKETKKMRPLFTMGIMALITANIIYANDELIYHHCHPAFSVAFAIFNCLGFVFTTLGVIKFIRFKKG